MSLSRHQRASTQAPQRLQASLPVLLFIAANRLAGLRVAVAVATVWSVQLAVTRWHRGQPFGVFMPILTALVVLRGAIGIVTDSEGVYFGLGIAGKYAIATAMAASIVLRRPLAQLAAPHLLGLTKDQLGEPAVHRALTGCTIIAGMYYLASATFDVWLFRRSSIDGYLIWRFLANWPLSIGALALMAATMQHYLRGSAGIAGLRELVEGRVEQVWPRTPGPSRQITVERGDDS